MEYVIAGASAVQVGTANFAQPTVCTDILDRLERRCMDSKINSINSLIGTFQAESP
jgi:dihydroorotate dehydrogenase (NAD+) catalytic subunit